MRKEIDVLQYTYSHGVLSTSLTTNVEVLDSDLNLALTAARLISVQAHLRSNEDWVEVKFMTDVLCKEFARHVALHSFMHNERLICVPTPGLSFQHRPIEHHIDVIELKIRHELAEEFNCIACGMNGHRSEFSGAMHADPDYVVISFRNYEPFLSFGEALYYGLFCGPREKWNFYTVPNLPVGIKLNGVKGIMFSGGKYSAASRETVEWMPNVKQFIRKIYYEFPNIKLFGHCLGAQLLAASLGGVVDKDPEHYFVLGTETVRLNEAGLQELKALPQEFQISELHRDYIQTLPPDGVLYATSTSCPVEVWGVPGRVLGLQGHAEYSIYMQYYYLSALCFRSGDVSQEAATLSITQAKELGHYDSAVVKALYAWFKD
mmetsp:Transcript_33348/g.58488  ORF Transcript_33348/g.58488 Transcript_33348/m.58488 type:complete len:376 (+) Transcript_33348:20-1147(+)